MNHLPLTQNTYTHWLHDRHLWGTGIRRIKLLKITDEHIHFIAPSGLEHKRLHRSVIRIESKIWQPKDSYDLYQQAVAAEACYCDDSTHYEIRELRLRSEYLLEKLSLVKYDHWALRAEGVLRECLMWYPMRGSYQLSAVSYQ